MISQVALGEITSEISRPVALEPGIPYRSVGVRWYGAGVHVHETREGHLFNADRFQIEQDDLIYNDMWARMGSVAIVPPDLAGAVASSHFPTFRLDESKVIPSYLSCYFRTPSFWDDCENASRGSTGRNQIKRRTFAAIQIPLPPLDEQRRIVARIESLAAKVEEARNAQKDSKRQLSALTNSYANAVFENSDVPTRPLSDISLLITDGTHQTPRYVDEGAIFLSAQNVKPFRFMPEVHRKVSNEDFLGYTARNKPARGDVLLTRVGAGIGEAAVVDQDIEFAIYVSLALIRPNANVLTPEYLVQWLNSPIGRSLSRVNTLGKGHSQGNLNLNLLRSFPVPLTSLAEQRRIVAELDALQAKADSVKALQSETAAELDALLPAILDKAFKGAL